MSTNQEIYQGFWVNHAEGPIVGATVTLSTSGGAYLIAFLALFVHLAGASFWRLIAYVIFQARVSSPADIEQDEVKGQQQAVLRNSTSSMSSIRGFTKISIRSKNVHKSLWLLGLASVNFVGFLLAGIFSSKVTSATSDVLLKPTHCGRWWKWSFDSSAGNAFNAEGLLEEFYEAGAVHQLRSTGSHYATVCYGTDSPPDDCTAFGRQSPSWTSSLHSGCPFEDSLCLHNSTFSIDSGPMDSTLDLGINSPPEDRLSLRVAKECSVLQTDGYMKTYTGSNISELFPTWYPAKEVFGYSMEGLTFNAFFYGYNNAEVTDATYIFNNGTFQVSSGDDGDTPTYILDVERFESGTSPLKRSTFNAIPGLVVPNQDTQLIFLSSAVRYFQPVTDPWFNAQIKDPFTWVYGPGMNFSTAQYRPKNPTSVLACASTAEICNRDPNSKGKCTRIMVDGYPPGDSDIPANITKILDLSQRQSAVAQRLQDASYRSDWTAIIPNVGAENMLAFQTAVNQGGLSFSNGLPSNQWTLEIQNWFAAQLTIMQLYTSQFVTGWQDEQYNKYVTLPPAEDRWMCDSQVIERKDYASFSVLGLCLIMVIGGGIIVLNLSLSRLVTWLRPETSMNLYRDASWDVNELLEMQSTAVLAMHRRASSFCESPVDTKAHVRTSEKALDGVTLQSSLSDSKQSQ